ncbi:MFS transporter [Amycolatopsis sp. Poz14]|uniref:MFS transporter n=1 Tax=Amycolatopsis sp. Poz14 TaxID=1447705 RepID=UPI001EE92454|nr:MFS transporter [Amycolatopsis sp. Poz14]MCG3754009.1 MFS transporter [Amycolatopsis sp. Poz14]
MTANLAARFERLPFTRYQRNLVLLIGTAYAFDGAELAVLTFALAPLRSAFGLTAVQAGLLASATFLGMAVGALAAGVVSDRIGRRSVICYSMYVWGIASLLVVFAWDFGSLAGFRFLTGLGMGAELPVAFAMLSEFLPTRKRGLLLGITNLAVTAGYLLIGAVSLACLATVGWRGVFVFMAALALFGVVVRRALPESPRWLESVGRHDEADVTMTEVEREVAAASGAPLPEPSTDAALAIEQQVRNPLRVLLSKAHRRRTLLAWAMWLLNIAAFYGITTWTAAVLVERGDSPLSAIGLVIAMYVWQIPGTVAASYLMDRVGRKAVFVVCLLLYAACAVLYVSVESTALILVFGSLLQFFSAGNTAANYTYTPELFPTRARASGIGSASAWGRVGAVAGPLLVPVLVGVWSYVGAFAVLAGMLALTALLLLVFGPETRNRQLEELSEQPLERHV